VTAPPGPATAATTGDATGDATDAPRRAWVAHVMGLPVSVHVRGPDAHGPRPAEAVHALVEDLRGVDARFSPYRADSEVSRLARGELRAEDCSPQVREVLALCDEAWVRTDGAFDADVPDGRGGTRFDPSGLVKGWAVERATDALTANPALDGHDVYVNAGGDLAVRCAAAGSTGWTLGIEDPDDPAGLLTALRVVRGGVATSGSAHRGPHIVEPSTGRPATALRAATVTGPSLMWADVLATAVVVRGSSALGWITGLDGYEAMVVLPAGTSDRLRATEGFLRLLADPPDAGGT